MTWRTTRLAGVPRHPDLVWSPDGCTLAAPAQAPPVLTGRESIPARTAPALTGVKPAVDRRAFDPTLLPDQVRSGHQISANQDRSRSGGCRWWMAPERGPFACMSPRRRGLIDSLSAPVLTGPSRAAHSAFALRCAPTLDRPAVAVDRQHEPLPRRLPADPENARDVAPRGAGADPLRHQLALALAQLPDPRHHVAELHPPRSMGSHPRGHRTNRGSAGAAAARTRRTAPIPLRCLLLSTPAHGRQDTLTPVKST